MKFLGDDEYSKMFPVDGSTKFKLYHIRAENANCYVLPSIKQNLILNICVED